MHLELIDYYLIGMNATGFVLYIINMWLYSHTEEGQIDRILTVASILGGSLGIVIAILLFDRKPVKDNMMSRVFVSCVLVIQIVVVLIFKGFIKNEITWTFWLLFDQKNSRSYTCSLLIF